VTGTISTIAAMEDKLGIFHGSLIKSVNKFIHKRCAQKYGPNAKVAEEYDDDGKPVKVKAPAASAAKAKPVREKPAAAPPETAKAKATP
jgi:hypothetical protein